MRKNPRMCTAAVVGLAAWALVPILFPFYIFSPGTPQISSVFLGLAVLALLVAGFRLPASSPSILKRYLWFIWYVCLVNLTWAVLSSNLLLLKPPTYYMYNLIAVVVCLALYWHAEDRFLNIALHAFVFSGCLQAVLLLVADSAGSRHSIYFDNPNQLGYFALVGAAAVVTLGDRLRMSLWYTGAGMGSYLFLVLASNSFAALGGFALLVMLALVRRPGMAVLAGVALVALSGMWDAEVSFFDRLASESTEMQAENVSFPASRGYDRLVNHPEHIFVGAGEGNYNLYESYLGKHEIHSSYGTLLFSYGIVGTLLFLWFTLSVVRSAGWRSGQFLLPILLYGVAHQGLRSTMLWTFIGILICLREESSRAPVMKAAGTNLELNPPILRS